MEVKKQEKQPQPPMPEKTPQTEKGRYILLDPLAWNFIVSYINDTPLTMAMAKRAVQVQDMIASAVLIDGELQDKK